MNRLFELLDVAAESCSFRPHETIGLLQEALREATSLHASPLWRDVAREFEGRTAATTNLAFERSPSSAVLVSIKELQRDLKPLLRPDRRANQPVTS